MLHCLTHLVVRFKIVLVLVVVLLERYQHTCAMCVCHSSAVSSHIRPLYEPRAP